MRAIGFGFWVAMLSISLVACGDDDNGGAAGMGGTGGAGGAGGAGGSGGTGGAGGAGGAGGSGGVGGVGGFGGSGIGGTGGTGGTGGDAGMVDAGPDAGPDAGMDMDAGADAAVREECQPHSFTVTDDDANGSYTVDGEADPTLTLCRGMTYTFQLDASGHPFYIKTQFQDSGTDNTFDDGVTNAGTEEGTVTFTVPADAPDTLYYQCSAHTLMSGELDIID